MSCRISKNWATIKESNSLKRMNPSINEYEQKIKISPQKSYGVPISSSHSNFDNKGLFVWYVLHKKCMYVFCYLSEGLSFVKRLVSDSPTTITPRL